MEIRRLCDEIDLIVEEIPGNSVFFDELKIFLILSLFILKILR